MSRSGKNKSWSLQRGATVFPGGVRFSVWAPHVKNLAVRVVHPVQKDIPMRQSSPELFEANLEGIGAGARYFFLFDDGRTFPDPVSRHQPEGVHGPSEVVDPERFDWADSDWRGIDLEDHLFYELHVGTFTPQGTFDGVIGRLGDLKALGISAIELMPIAQFPGNRNWGYDGVDLYAVQNSYGGPEGLRRLVDAAHRTGLSVVLDVVYNHLGHEGNYLRAFGPYFTQKYKTPWGDAINYDDRGCKEVRKFIVENALYWIDEYHIDAFRLDAIHGIFDFSAKHILQEVGEAVHRLGATIGQSLYLFPESDLNDPRLIRSIEQGGYGLDAQWNDDFHHSLHTLLTGEQQGYYADFGRLDQMAKAICSGFVYDGNDSVFRGRPHGAPSDDLPGSSFVVFSQNHDQVGNRLMGDRLSTLVPFEALSLAAAVTLLSQSLPLLFMGEEYGETAPFLYFTHYGDPKLAEAVRQGRKREFADFAWQGEPPDPQSTETFDRSRTNPLLSNQEANGRLLEFYRTLIAFRKSHPVFRDFDRRNIQIHTDNQERVIGLRRNNGSETLLILFSFNPAAAELHLPNRFL
ncbi:MAG TPA: malto-oligosyltrehalose trehalohydrolase, partial [Nitrospiria bacterium]|nr:malto-oligosyltrehalose trehalohydrolase [Nitrospiria bacterium]